MFNKFYDVLSKYAYIILAFGLVVGFSGAHMERIEFQYWHPYLTYVGKFFIAMGIAFWRFK